MAAARYNSNELWIYKLFVLANSISDLKCCFWQWEKASVKKDRQSWKLTWKLLLSPGTPQSHFIGQFDGGKILVWGDIDRKGYEQWLVYKINKRAWCYSIRLRPRRFIVLVVREEATSPQEVIVDQVYHWPTLMTLTQAWATTSGGGIRQTDICLVRKVLIKSFVHMFTNSGALPAKTSEKLCCLPRGRERARLGN
jgi:hypothetical protein